MNPDAAALAVTTHATRGAGEESITATGHRRLTHDPALDSVRGISMLLVLVGHVGFVGGSLFAPDYIAERIAIEFLASHLPNSVQKTTP